jgi:hypothetical protein
MRRLLAPLALAASLAAVVAGGCGVIADDTAATYGSTDIPTSLVDAMASDEALVELLGWQAATGESVVPGSTARNAIDLALEAEALFEVADDAGVEYSADVAALEQALSGTPAPVEIDDLDPEVRDFLARYTSASAALGAATPELPEPSEGELREIYRSLSDDLAGTCLTLVAVPADVADAATEAIEGGGGLEEAVEGVEGAQVVFTAATDCPGGDDLATNLPPDLLAQVESAEPGERVGPVTVEGQQSDFLVWFEVESRGAPAFEDARERLVALAAGSPLAVRIVLDSTVNPRYGGPPELTLSTDARGQAFLRATVARPEAPEPTLVAQAPAATP